MKKEIAPNVTKILINKGMTLEEIAYKTGAKYPTVRSWFTEERHPNMWAKRELSRLLKELEEKK